VNSREKIGAVIFNLENSFKALKKCHASVENGKNTKI
jgi:hypothetical protein